MEMEVARRKVAIKPVLDELNKKNEDLKLLEKYGDLFKVQARRKLKHLSQGVYEVFAIKDINTMYGPSYRLILKDKFLVGCNANYKIQSVLNEALTPELKKQLLSNGFYTLYNKPIAMLEITGRGYTKDGFVMVYCNFDLCINQADCVPSLIKETTKEIAACKENIAEASKIEMHPLPVINTENILLYKDLDNLCVLPLHTCHCVTAIGYKKHYGKDKLVVKLDDGNMYQAGDYLEEHVNELYVDTKIYLTKVLSNANRHKYAVCKIIQLGDWAGLLDYNNVKLLPKERQPALVMDVKTVNVKGVKRKLLLLEDGSVYKIKRSKLEDTVEVGNIV